MQIRSRAVMLAAGLALTTALAGAALPAALSARTTAPVLASHETSAPAAPVPAAATSTPSPEPSVTAVPAASKTPEPTAVPTATPSATPEPTAVPAAAPQATIAPTPVAAPTAVPSPAATVAPAPEPLSVTAGPSTVRVGQTFTFRFTGVQMGDRVTVTQIVYPSGYVYESQRSYTATMLPYVLTASLSGQSGLGTYTYRFSVRGQALAATLTLVN